MPAKRCLTALAASALALAVPAAGFAQDKAISIELNDATNADTACRLVFVAINRSGVLLDKTSYDFVTFDTEGKVGRSITFHFGRLPVGKTKVVEFALAGVACTGISRILVNTAPECIADGAASTICLDALRTTSLSQIVFDQ